MSDCNCNDKKSNQLSPEEMRIAELVSLGYSSVEATIAVLGSVDDVSAEDLEDESSEREILSEFIQSELFDNES